jgi:hypothetical protein
LIGSVANLSDLEALRNDEDFAKLFENVEV